MPENISSTQKDASQRRRPTSDIIMETDHHHHHSLLLPEVAIPPESNKQHISMMLARSRSLDALSSPALLPPEKVYDGDDDDDDDDEEDDEDDDTSSISISDASSKSGASSMMMTGKDISSPSKSEVTLLKDKSELTNYSNNNNNIINNDSFRNSSSRSSSISTTSSSGSSSYSGGGGGDGASGKVGRRSSSSSSTTTTNDMGAGGAGVPFRKVVLKEPVRITGYLEKRSKVLGWKKFWFVLDGRLLTYYKSKTDYESLSACCGCINLGIASTVRPIQLRGCKGYPLQIVTRSQVYYLRSPEKPVLEQWLLAIQEASSSAPPSSALTSWNSCAGSQYFRHSFASQSQWSLNNSAEDITDISQRLGNLPDTFYQKRDRGSLIYPTPPLLSQPSPVIHKCHSFQSLQTSVVSQFGGREGLYGRRVLLSSTENLRDLEEEQVGNKIGKSGRMSTSLLALDSSPQAAELRKELTRKLSAGSSNNDKDDKKSDKDGGTGNVVPTPKFLLLSAKKKGQGQSGGGGEEDSHHYDEIGDFIVGNKPHYENCDAEKSSSKRSSLLLRGESAEKESNIYEHVDSHMEQMSLDSSQVGWEGNDPGRRFLPPHHRLSASNSNRNSLVSISEVPEELSSISPSPIKTSPVHQLSSIPESSWQSGVEPFKSLSKPYSEDEELSSSRSESFRSLPSCAAADKPPKKRKGKAAIGGFFAKVFGKNFKGKGGKVPPEDNSSPHHRPMLITGPIDLKKQTQMQELPPRKPPQSYPYKKSSPPTTKNHPIPTKSIPSNDETSKPLEVSRQSPTLPGSRISIHSPNVMEELKQKVGHITLKRTSSSYSGSGSDAETSPPKETTPKTSVVEARVPYVPRQPSSTDAVVNKPSPVLIFHNMQDGNKSNESNTDDDIISIMEQKEVQTASMSMSPEVEGEETSCSEGGTLPRAETKLEAVQMFMPPPPPAPPLPQKLTTPNGDVPDGRIPPQSSTPPVVKRNEPRSSDPESDFQNKLAKFNRLSQRLSANFIAALHPTHTNHQFNSINRSSSFKTSKGKGHKDESLPPLPPKKRNAAGLISASLGTIALYDVPLNNKPVLFKRPKDSSTDSLDNFHHHQGANPSGEKTIAAFIRDLTKKNSTPDIVLSGNSSSTKGISLRDVMTDPKELRNTLDGNGSSSDESLHKHISPTTTTPPGRPPKPKPPAKPKSLEFGGSRVKRTSESSTSSEGSSSSSEQSQLTPVMKIPSQTVIKVSGGSPASSNKSLNKIDNLSDNTNASKAINCPIHPPPSSDFAFSTDAISPESMLSFSDKIVPDSLAPTPDTLISTLGSSPDHQDLPEFGVDSDMEPLSINKLEIVIRDNDGSPDNPVHSPDNESRLDSLERRPGGKCVSVTPTTDSSSGPVTIYQNLKFATVSTLIQEFETVEENEDEVSELYDDFPSEFYTPTPSSFSGYSPSEISTSSSDSSTSTLSIPSSSTVKKHARIDAIRHSGMEQLEAFLNFGGTPSSEDCSFESCIDNFSEEDTRSKSSSSGGTPTTPQPLHNHLHHNNNNNQVKGHQIHNNGGGGGQHQQQTINSSSSSGGGGVNRTGAISRLGHSSAVGHLQKILTSDKPKLKN